MSERDKLMKAMRLLGSDQPGERQAAAEAVWRLTNAAGIASRT